MLGESSESCGAFFGESHTRRRESGESFCPARQFCESCGESFESAEASDSSESFFETSWARGRESWCGFWGAMRREILSAVRCEDGAVRRESWCFFINEFWRGARGESLGGAGRESGESSGAFGGESLESRQKTPAKHFVPFAKSPRTAEKSPQKSHASHGKSPRESHQSRPDSPSLEPQHRHPPPRVRPDSPPGVRQKPRQVRHSQSPSQSSPNPPKAAFHAPLPRHFSIKLIDFIPRLGEHFAHQILVLLALCLECH